MSSLNSSREGFLGTPGRWCSLCSSARSRRHQTGASRKLKLFGGSINAYYLAGATSRLQTAKMTTNGCHVSPEHAEEMNKVFPEALSTLQEADPELAAVIKDEQKRQW